MCADPSPRFAVSGVNFMSHHENHTATPRSWFDRLLERFHEWLFAAGEDSRAAARGWQVTRVPGSRRHVYRDPRWDTVHACEPCGGTGWWPYEDAVCPDCAGDGVVHAIPAAALAAEHTAGRTGGRS